MHDSPLNFAPLLAAYRPEEDAIAAGVSGGPDSIALCHALALAFPGKTIHALTVDHGLRAGAAAEAEQVGQWLKGDGFRDIKNLSHQTLTREITHKPAARIQEEAREDRYALMASYCRSQNITALFVAHHQDDQAETFLFRLAKGSGLDGLGAMQAVTDYHGQDQCLKIIRPFLDTPKEELIAYCETHHLPYLQDPSNDDTRFARARLRQAHDVLAEEGLSAKRLSVTASRLSRAREALDFYTVQTFERAVKEKSPVRIVFDFQALADAPQEIRLRVLLKAMALIGPPRVYPPRLEKCEALAAALFGDPAFKRASLAGCLVGIDRKESAIIIEKEKKSPNS